MSRITSIIRALAGAAFLAGPAACGAINHIVLYLSDTPGESRLERYPKWIDVDSFEVGVTNLVDLSAGAGSRPLHNGLTVVKRLDASSPKLALWCGYGSIIPSARLEFTRTTNGEPRFYVIELAEVRIAAISAEGQEDDGGPFERVTLSYSGIEEIYTPLRANGQPAPDVYVWWSVLSGQGGSSAVDCITASPASIQGVALSTVDVTVQIPPLLNIGATIGVSLRSSDPNVVSFPGASDGRKLLAFPEASGPTATAQLSLLRPGRATITLERPGECIANSIDVAVGGALVRNPSFEENLPPTWPHYGEINGWTGATYSGVNGTEGPFQDNGLIPDRGQVAFVQGNGTLSQQITGLEADKEYWLQFSSNARNCCGGSTSLSVRFDAATIASLGAVNPVGALQPYRWANIPFVPRSNSGVLEFVASAIGDASLLLDSVSIIRRDAKSVVLRNPSFEASGIPTSPGYLVGTSLDGWVGTGNFGVNASGAGPFADNGIAPDQSGVLFLQQAQASVAQKVTGLVPNAPYTLSFAVNARSGNLPVLKVSFGSAVLVSEEISPVGAGKPYRLRAVTFRPTADSGTLRFEQTQANGDNTVLIDDVILTPGSTAPAAVPLVAKVVESGQLRLSWPVSPYGFTVQASEAVEGPWLNAGADASVQGTENVVYLPAASGERYFRLTNW